MEWKTKLAEKSKPLTDFLFFLAKRAQNDMIFRVASSLAYTSLIALVPLSRQAVDSLRDYESLRKQ